MLRAALILLAASVLVATAATAGHSGPSRKPCGAGSVSAVVGGKHVCLKRGQPCRQALDRIYHRYRFHCHAGRLTRFAPPPPPVTTTPAPTPEPPPALPEPPPPTGSLIDVGGYRLMLPAHAARLSDSGPGGSRWSSEPTRRRNARIWVRVIFS